MLDSQAFEAECFWEKEQFGVKKGSSCIGTTPRPRYVQTLKTHCVIRKLTLQKQEMQFENAPRVGGKNEVLWAIVNPPHLQSAGGFGIPGSVNKPIWQINKQMEYN